MASSDKIKGRTLDKHNKLHFRGPKWPVWDHTPEILSGACVGRFFSFFPGTKAHKLLGGASGGPKWGGFGSGQRVYFENVSVRFLSLKDGFSWLWLTFLTNVVALNAVGWTKEPHEGKRTQMQVRKGAQKASTSNQKNSSKLWQSPRRNSRIVPDFGADFLGELFLPENSQTLARIACHAPGESGRN